MLPNNRLEFALTRPTRKSEALLLAAQPERWASHIRICSFALALWCALPSLAAADPASEFEVALAKWRAADLKSYSFVYEWSGGVVIAPRCADAKIRVVVQNGVSSTPVVARGSSRCPRGTRGDKAIGFSVPDTVDEAFAEMRRYIHEPPTPARINATYDPALGVPLTYYAEKLEITDNDEGFRISSFKILQ